MNMTISKAGRILLIVGVIAVPTGFCEIIPQSRRVTWQGNVGIPGGIPNSSNKTVYTTIAAGASRSTVETALENCPANQVVQLSAGSYSWSDTLDWLGVNNGVVLRGAGRGQTVITWSSFSGTGINFRGRPYSEPPFSVEANLSANATKDANTLTLSSVPSWVTVGDLIGVDQLDDTAYANQDGFNLRTVLGNGERNMSQLSRVTAKTATTITLETPNAWSWSTARTAQIFQPGYVPSTDNPLIGCGIEGMTFTYTFSGTDAHPVTMYICDRCYLKDVEINNMPGGRAIITYYSYQCEFRRLYIHDSHLFAGGQGYCLDLNDSTCSSLVEDCIFEDYHVGVTVRYGSTFNVIAYNYFKNSSAASSAAQTAAMSTHGCHALMNLWEGNWTNDKVLCDYTLGSASHNTVFRCLIEGRNFGSGDATAISDEYYNRYWNFIGNILGVNGLHNKYAAHSGSTAAGSTGTILKMGGEVNVNSDYSPSDTFSYTSGMFVLLHGNWDYVQDQQTWEPSIADHSLPNSYYLTSKPSFFGNRPWPPYDPANPSSATATNIPAGYRMVMGTDPPSDSTVRMKLFESR